MGDGGGGSRKSRTKETRNHAEQGFFIREEEGGESHKTRGEGAY